MGQKQSVTYLLIPEGVNNTSLDHMGLRPYLSAESDIRSFISDLKKKKRVSSKSKKRELDEIISELEKKYCDLKSSLSKRICQHFKCSDESPMPLTREYYRLECESLYRSVNIINTYLNSIKGSKKEGDIVLILDDIQKFFPGKNKEEYTKLKERLEFIIATYKQKMNLISKMINKDYNIWLSEIFKNAKTNPYYKEHEFLEDIKKDESDINIMVNAIKDKFGDILRVYGGQQNAIYQFIYIIIIILLIIIIFYFAWCFISKNSMMIRTNP